MFGVVACVHEVAVTPGELLADADIIHYTMGDPQGGGLLHNRKASAVDWSCLPFEGGASGKGNWDQQKHTTCRG